MKPSINHEIIGEFLREKKTIFFEPFTIWRLYVYMYVFFNNLQDQVTQFNYSCVVLSLDLLEV